MYKGYYLFRMNYIMKEMCEIRNCIEVLTFDVKIYTIDRICSTVNKKFQGTECISYISISIM